MGTDHERYIQYINSAAWKKVVDAFFVENSRECAQCGKRRHLQVHHRTYEHLYAEIGFLGDLVCLCGRHHMMAHGLIAPKQRRRRARRSVVLVEDVVSAVACPRCGRAAGRRCGGRGAHRERVRAARGLVREVST